jgi:ankyrin repeat protein
VNVRDKTGRTPLHLCWERADCAVWKISPLLVDAGARFDIPDRCGQTVPHHALQYSNSSWIHHTINTSHELGFGKQNLDGNVALHYAVMRRYDGVNNHGQSPLTLAVQSYDQRLECIFKQMLARVDEGVGYELQADE